MATLKSLGCWAATPSLSCTWCIPWQRSFWLFQALQALAFQPSFGCLLKLVLCQGMRGLNLNLFDFCFMCFFNANLLCVLWLLVCLNCMLPELHSLVAIGISFTFCRCYLLSRLFRSPTLQVISLRVVPLRRCTCFGSSVALVGVDSSLHVLEFHCM